MKLLRKNKFPLINIIACILCAIYPILFLYFRNSAEMSFGEVQKIFWLSVLFAIITLAVIMCIMRDWNKAGIISIIFILVCENYSFIAKLFNLLFPNMKYWHIVAILLFVFIWGFIFVKTAKKQEIFSTISIICGLVFGVLILFNTITAIPTLAKKISISQAEKGNTAESTLENNETNDTENLPNIYYMILDECASFNVIQKYYGYDDTSFRDYLEKNHFTVSENSHNESLSTHIVLTNCLNLEYIVDDSASYELTESYLKNALLYQLLQKNGYTFRGVGDTTWLGIDSTSSSNAKMSQTINGETITQLFMQQTVIAPFMEQTQTEQVKLIKNALLTLQNESNFYPNSSIFTLFYICSPHQPFLFDKNGDSISPTNYANWNDDQYYLGQYQYITQEIQKCIDNILANDPNCVILLTSDHGPRFKEEIPYEDKSNILNCVYFQGHTLNEIKNESQVNTLRIILNRIIGTSFQKVEVEP